MVNTRILIGQSLGEIYFIIQNLHNNKWKSLPNEHYRGSYFVNKKVQEVLKYIKYFNNIKKHCSKDILSFKIDKSIEVIIDDYTKVRKLPELKKLDNIITVKNVVNQLDNNLKLVKEMKKVKVKGLVATSIASLGIITGLSLYSTNIKEDEKINAVENLQYEFINDVNVPIINNMDYNYKIQEDFGNTKRVVFYEPSTLDQENSKIDLFFDGINSKEKMISEYAKMYYMDTNTVSKIYNDNINAIENSENPEQTFIIMVKDAFYEDSSIDKNSMITNLTSQEKEQFILNMATNIYKVEDEETLSLLLAIHRLEASWGQSDRCIYDNNPGGLIENGEFLTFKSFEIGAECFVRNVLRIKNETLAKSDYNYNETFEYNMQMTYCPDNGNWNEEVLDLKNSIIENNELLDYLQNNKKMLKTK